MADIEAIAQAINFIEAHLREPVGVAEMAEATSYSLYHFCRTFHQATGCTPYDYLMRRRVAEAAQVLTQGDAKVIEVAFDYQFNSHETFSRAFKRVTGVPPNQWRKQKPDEAPALMPRITESHLCHWQRSALWQPAPVERTALSLVGVMTLPKTARETAWTWLRYETAGCADDLKEFFMLTFLTDHGRATLAAAVAPATFAEGRALVSKTLPPLRYARFNHRGPAGDLDLTLDYIYQVWLPQSDYRLALPLYLETCDAFPDAPSGEWGVEIPVEKNF
ncbi:MAG: AraC family transcriptional regulator [Anaerolineae bacterium]|nr:AraC family transcriptional regulator [Anaerolineae bacterium]